MENVEQKPLIHIRTDNNVLNADRKFVCGIGPELPKGDLWYQQYESMADFATCPKCNPIGPRRLGTPISQLSGRPGQPGYSEFVRIARSYGFD